jgi:hypothetical protein
MVEVWTDEYKRLFYMHRRDLKVSYLHFYDINNVNGSLSR